MARLNSQAKAGYYPFTPEFFPLIERMFIPNEGANIADLCAGQGFAIEYFQRLGGQTFVNELQPDLYKDLKEVFPQAVSDDFFNLRLTNEGLSWLWLNPPYDYEDKQRLEYKFLTKVHDKNWIAKDGIVCWVVYTQHLTKIAAKHLAKNYAEVDVYFCPENHLGHYQQIVVVARKGQNPHLSAEDILVQLENPVYLDEVEKQYWLPNIEKRVAISISNYTTEYLETLWEDGLEEVLNQNVEIPPFENPIRRPNDGQIAVILSSGVFNGLRFFSDKLNCHVTIRTVISREEVETDTGIRNDKMVHTYQNRPKTILSAIAETGQIFKLQSDEDMLSFIREYGSVLLDHYLEEYKPLYNEDYSFIGKYLNDFSFKGKHLFLAQKHAVAATIKALEEKRGIIVVGEMGTGKTVQSVAVSVAYLNNVIKNTKKPNEKLILIQCPGTLVQKWKREFEVTKDFDGKVFIIEDIDDAAKAVRYKKDHLDEMVIGVFSFETGKLGEKRQPAVFQRKIHKYTPSFRAEGEPVWNENGKVIAWRQYACPTTGDLIKTTDKRSGTLFAPDLKYFEEQPRWNENFALWQNIRTFKKANTINPKTGYLNNPRMSISEYFSKVHPDMIGLYIFDELHEAKSDESALNNSMMMLATRADRFIGLTGTLYGGKASSVFSLLLLVSPIILNNYGFDGKQKFIEDFGILEYTIEHDVESGRAGTYSNKKPKKTTPKEVAGISPALVGIMMSCCIFVNMRDMADVVVNYEERDIPIPLDNDMQAAYNRAESTLKAYLMERLNDGDYSFMGTYLNELFHLPETMWRKSEVKHKPKPKKTFYSKYSFDQEPETFNQEINVYTHEAMDYYRIYPKEQYLLELIETELAAGRGVAVYVEQTDTKDIRPRIAALIEENISKANILMLDATSPKPEKREQHLMDQIALGKNVLITNPRLVKVGLDLLAFPTLIFHEIGYSLYNTNQAARRAWRLNQTKDCKTYFLHYNGGTIEQQAMSIIKKKSNAAAILYGTTDEAGIGALTDSSGDIKQQLTKTLLESIRSR